MKKNDKKIIIFDLDGTLAESKQTIDKEMALLLRRLLEYKVVAVISGGTIEQLRKAVADVLPKKARREHLLLLPTSGASLFVYKNDKWIGLYQYTLTQEEIDRITSALMGAIGREGLKPEKTYGDLIENRTTQVTYSGLGQLAPLEEKSAWDPDQTKRKKIVEIISGMLPEFSIRIGGMTSIDINKRGIDKEFGIKKLEEYVHLPNGLADMLFVGDALYPGGNDEPAKKTGIECIQVKTVSDTKKLIRSMVGGRFLTYAVYITIIIAFLAYILLYTFHI
jgi:HAD superfamily hydrolase (TIGR01484 family)